MTHTPLTACRVCDNTELIEYIDLGMLPLSNNLMATQDEQPGRYPLKVLLCTQCGLSQLSIIVDPVLLFGHYVYRSSINEGYNQHCKQMAIDLQKSYGLTSNSFHIDIAGNDGALLYQFSQVIGCKSLNVDPAINMVPICEAKRIRQYAEFWGTKAAAHLKATHWKKADLITATNVFAHVHDVKDFLIAAKETLSDNGVLILEFPYLVDFIEKNEFDTIYFEHLSYFGIRPLQKLCNSTGLTIVKVEHKDIHGGTVRVHIGFGEQDSSVTPYVLKEYSLTLDRYIEFSNISHGVIRDFRNNVKALPGKVAAFAASAKGNTLMNCAGITSDDIDYIVDETPEKIGKYSPGTGIPIVSMDALVNNPPDYLIILSWNFADAIMNKCRAAGYAGKFIIPIPEFKIL
jgi:hypothetical protein